jgi:hypothetical protein
MAVKNFVPFDPGGKRLWGTNTLAYCTLFIIRMIVKKCVVSTQASEFSRILAKCYKTF